VFKTIGIKVLFMTLFPFNRRGKKKEQSLNPNSKNQ